MQTLPDSWPDEAPTRVSEHVPGALLTFASRVDRLAELALERLMCAPDPDAIAAAVCDLLEVRELAQPGAPMSAPDEKSPAPPPSESDVVIAKGKARAAVVVVLADLARSVGRTEQLMQAMARALDEAATK